MLIIFLDLDGVLNSENSFMYRRLTDGNPKHFASNPNPMSVALLDYVLYVTNANIVISSSWRGPLIEKLKETLREEFGLVRVDRIIDQTPRYLRPGHVDRGEEIQHWLDNNKSVWTNYVIIDDDSDMLESQKDHFVQTNFEHGFTVRDMHKVLNIFGFQDEEVRLFNTEKALKDFQAGVDRFTEVQNERS